MADVEQQNKYLEELYVEKAGSAVGTTHHSTPPRRNSGETAKQILLSQTT